MYFFWTMETLLRLPQVVQQSSLLSCSTAGVRLFLLGVSDGQQTILLSSWLINPIQKSTLLYLCLLHHHPDKDAGLPIQAAVSDLESFDSSLHSLEALTCFVRQVKGKQTNTFLSRHPWACFLKLKTLLQLTCVFFFFPIDISPFGDGGLQS